MCLLAVEHQLLVYADNVNILGGRVRTVKENAEALVVASKENGIDVNVDKTKHMVMCGDQNAGRIHKTKTDSSYCNSVEQFKCLRRTLTNSYCNSVQQFKCLRRTLTNSYCNSVEQFKCLGRTLTNSYCNSVEQFKCLRRTLTNPNFIQEEIKSRLTSRNACYYLVKDLLSSSLLSKNINMKICKI